MSGFRSLGDEEEVEFECQVSEKGLEATKVTGPQSSDCRGSHRRPLSKKRFRKIRYLITSIFPNDFQVSINKYLKRDFVSGKREQNLYSYNGTILKLM